MTAVPTATRRWWRRWLHPRLAFRAWRRARRMAWLQRWKAALSDPLYLARSRAEEEAEHGRVVITPDTFYLLKDGQRAWTVPWAEVFRIRTFKRDRFSHDLTFLAFDLADGATVEVEEHVADFFELNAALRRRFPGIPNDWYQTVMLPAFAANERVLWSWERSADR